MKAKEDLTLTDPAGLDRKVFAGQEVPAELVDAYEDATKSSKAKAEKAPEKDKAQRSAERDK